MAVLTRTLCLLITWLCIEQVPYAKAEENLQLHEQEIKAGLLYNFLKYTDWPPASLIDTSSMVVCIFGDDPFEGYLKPMAGRTVNQRIIAVRYIHSVHEVQECHLLFINSNEKRYWPDLHNAVAGKSILTVSDFAGFSTDGGMIEFGHKNNHISAVLNADSMTAEGLHMQDRLLRLVSAMHASRQEKQP